MRRPIQLAIPVLVGLTAWTAVQALPSNARHVSHLVTAQGDGNESIDPSGVQTVAHGSRQAFTVPVNGGFQLSWAVGGSCPSGGWTDDVYTTGPITDDCEVSFSATAKTPASRQAASELMLFPAPI